MILKELQTALNSQRPEENRFYGLVSGFVVDLKDPANLGRVKVTIPELFKEGKSETVFIKPTGKEDRGHSYWARLATLMGGSERGTYFVPEVGDEVLVAFELGYMNRPVIVGALWNADAKPPVTMDGDGKNDVRAIHSRSGHKIVLNDAKDKPSILISDKDGKNQILIDLDPAKKVIQIKVEDDLKIEAGGNISITAKGKIDIKASQGLAAESDADVSIKAKSKAAVESSGPLTLKSSSKVAVEGSMQAEIKAAAVSVNGSGLTEIKGGIVKIN